MIAHGRRTDRASPLRILPVDADRRLRMERRAVFDQLDTEWSHLAETAYYQRELDRWAAHSPAFEGIGGCRDLIGTLLDRSCEWQRKDAILLALVLQARRGDDSNPIAARVVLQAMLPGVRTFVRRLSHTGDREEADAAMLAGMVAAIADYPCERRPHRVAINLLWLAYEHARKTCRRYDAEIAVGLDIANGSNPFVAESSTVELLGVVGCAVEQRIVGPDEARLLLRLRVADVRAGEIAAQEGVCERTIDRRRRLAERRLRDSARELWAS